MEDKKTLNKVCFAAIDPYKQNNIPLPIQKDTVAQGYVPYGVDNLYPQYLLGLYEECSTLKSIIDGNVDYVLGDDFILDAPIDKVKAADLMREVILDYYVFGYGFIQVIRNPLGEVIDLVHLPSEYVRTDKDHQSFWYCEKWKGYGRAKSVVYPAFMNSPKQPTGVLMLGSGRGTYPAPLWSAAVKDAETERKIDEFHLNEISNNFLTSMLINFNNGRPSDEVKEEISRNLEEKHSGSENAGRFLLSFNESVTNRTTVERLGTDDFDKRYEALAKRTREQLFISFKAQPILFGLTSETSTGFSTTEFADLFKLYNKTMISPRQDMLKRAFAKIYGRDVLTITPFTI